MTTNRSKREMLREKKRAQKRRSVYTLVLIIIGIVVIFGSAALLPKIFAKPLNYETNKGFTIGDPNAPVTVIAFSNYTCGHCKLFSESLEKDFILDYVESGKVFYRYVNLPSNNELSLNAAEASYCAADQNKFFEYKRLLYTYANASDGFSVENLSKYTKSAGLDKTAFDICMSEDKYAQAYLEDREYARSAGIRGTPTFLVNGQLVTSSELIQTVEAILAD